MAAEREAHEASLARAALSEARPGRTNHDSVRSAPIDPALARRKRRAPAGARTGGGEGSAFFRDGDFDEMPARAVRIEPAPSERLSRSDLRARRERMEKSRRRRALQRQLTFGLMGRETDPEALTAALPKLEESLTGSIKVTPTKSDWAAPETLETASSRKADREAEKASPSTGVIELDVTVDDPTPTGELSTRRDLRGKRPKTGRRGADRGPIGRAVSNKRAWMGAIAMALVVAVPGVHFLDSRESVEDAALTSDSDSMPSLTQTRPPAPTSEELVENQKRLGKATATTKKATKSATETKDAKKSKSPSATETTTEDSSPTTKKTKKSTQVGLANLSDKASGLGWASGLYMPGSNADNADKFGDWRGAGVDVIVDWPARQTWDDLINPGWLYDSWKNTSYTKAFGFPPFPEDGSNLSSCAAGAYNDKWKQIATNIKAAGLDDTTVMRLGWEFNGDWYAWAAKDPKAFIGCWRQVYTAAESIAPKLTWDWNANRGPSQALPNPTDAYPGDEYVDIVGVDSYDMWPGATNEATWNEHMNGKNGLNFWVDFAKSHNKKLSVPEWGVYPGTAQAGNNGGDNAFYIGKMKEFFKSLGNQLAYEAYFNEDAGYYAGSIFGNVQNPSAAARYKSLFGS